MDPLSVIEGRVVATLVEKQLTTPQYYPLTLSALVAACNQTTNREPVTSYGEQQVLDALESLKLKHFARAVLPNHGRSVVRYRHVLDEALGLDAPQLAVLSVLVLRGPQTVSELRARTERMASIESVDHELGLLASRDDPLVELLGRGPGQREDRWSSTLAAPANPPGSLAGHAPTMSPAAEVESARGAIQGVEPHEERAEVDIVRAELEALRVEVQTLRTAVDALRESLGG